MSNVLEGVYYPKEGSNWERSLKIWVVPGGGPKWVRYCVGNPNGCSVSAMPLAEFLEKYRPETDEDRKAELTAAADSARRRYEKADADWLRAENALAQFTGEQALKQRPAPAPPGWSGKRRSVTATEEVPR